MGNTSRGPRVGFTPDASDVACRRCVTVCVTGRVPQAGLQRESGPFGPGSHRTRQALRSWDASTEVHGCLDVLCVDTLFLSKGTASLKKRTQHSLTSTGKPRLMYPVLDFAMQCTS